MSRAQKQRITVLGNRFPKGFVAIGDEELNSIPWVLLTPVQREIYVLMLRECRNRENPCQYSYKTEFSLPYQSIRHSDSTIYRAITALEKTGFIDIVKPGGLYRGMNLYALSQRWRKYKPTEKEQRKLGRKRRTYSGRQKRNKARRIQVIKEYQKKLNCENRG